MSPEYFREKFVVGLGGDTRNEIWERLRSKVITPIEALDIRCDLWINGSFITKCASPGDLDGSIMISSDELRRVDQNALNFLNQIDDSEKPFDEKLDLYLCVLYPRGHGLHGGFNDPDGWAQQWSSEHNSDWLKGFVVIPMQVKHGYL